MRVLLFLIMIWEIALGLRAQAQTEVGKMAEGPAEQAAARVRQIMAGFAEVQADYERVQKDIADLIRVRLDLSPELLLPGEQIALTIEARSTRQPNPVLEVLEDCYRPTPRAHTFHQNPRSQIERSG